MWTKSRRRKARPQFDSVKSMTVWNWLGDKDLIVAMITIMKVMITDLGLLITLVGLFIPEAYLMVAIDNNYEVIHFETLTQRLANDARTRKVQKTRIIPLVQCIQLQAYEKKSKPRGRCCRTGDFNDRRTCRGWRVPGDRGRRQIALRCHRSPLLANRCADGIDPPWRPNVPLGKQFHRTPRGSFPGVEIVTQGKGLSQLRSPTKSRRKNATNHLNQKSMFYTTKSF